MEPLHPIFKNICAQFGMTEREEEVPSTYRGYGIMEVWKYRDLNNDQYISSDWNITNPDGETGYLEHDKTWTEVKASIDEIIEENSND